MHAGLPLGIKKLARALEEFGTYIDNNASGIVNYGERHRCGERISTGFVESTINQLVAKRFVKNSRCDGHHAERISYCRSESRRSMTIYMRASNAGIQISASRKRGASLHSTPPTFGYSPFPAPSGSRFRSHRTKQLDCFRRVDATVAGLRLNPPCDPKGAEMLIRGSARLLNSQLSLRKQAGQRPERGPIRRCLM
jgi:hypothetical protein